MIDFHPFLRPAAIVLPLLVAVGTLRFARRRRRVADAFRGTPFAGELRRFGRLRSVLVLGASVALGVALYDPARSAEAAAGRRGGPVVLVLDVSSSMLTEDVAPSRLELMRGAARELAHALGDTPLGIVVFAGRAYALTPPTVDPAAIDLYLDALDPSMVTQTGSALGAAIRQGAGLLASTRTRSGTLVLLSDGDALEATGEEELALRLTKRLGAPVFTVGVGTPSGGPVPDVDFRTGRRSGFKREPGGATVTSRLGEMLLTRIARSTGGRYVALAGPGAVEELAAALRAAPGGTRGPGGRGGYEWLAAAALLLLALEPFLPRLGRPEQP